MLVAAAFCLQPVLALNESVSITYRGSGGSYIGDTVIFDGHNTAGNITVLRLTGPDLPAGGVPVYNLNGVEGTGNPVEVNADGSWRFAWYTSTIRGIEKMQTARYYITALDLADPSQSSTTSIMMKKPEFYIVAAPNPLQTGEYLLLVGNAEKGSTDIHITITDSAGTILHTYDLAASASGYFNYGFHVDMQPGIYDVTMSSPSAKSTYHTTITVIPPPPAGNVSSGTTNQSPASPVTLSGPASQVSPGTFSLSSTPSGAFVYLDSTPMGETPVVLQNVVPGSHLVMIKYPGYLTYTVNAQANSGETTTISPTLVKNPVSLPLSPLTPLFGLAIAGALGIIRSAGRKNE
ncbi:MAG: PEGA domain-containing protein [Methanoregula sp.]|nr:PEGA domain-containing protein [Methanoregula sp.]